MNRSNLSLSSYLNLIQRSLACISKLASQTTAYTRPSKFVLFDSRLHDLKLPMTKEPLKFLEAGDGDQYRQVHALPLVETYFQMAGIFEDGRLSARALIPSIDSRDLQIISLYHHLRATRRPKMPASANNYDSTMLIDLLAILFCVNGARSVVRPTLTPASKGRGSSGHDIMVVVTLGTHQTIVHYYALHLSNREFANHIV